VPEHPERRLGRLEKFVDVFHSGIGSAQAGDSAESVDPPPRLGERDPHEVAAARPRPSRERHHRPEGREVSRRVVERLSGKVFRPIQARCGPALVSDATHRLDQAVEPATLSPGSDVAVGAQGDVDDARPEPRQLLGG